MGQLLLLRRAFCTCKEAVSPKCVCVRQLNVETPPWETLTRAQFTTTATLQMSATDGPVFRPSRVLQWAVLSEHEREQFTRFIVENNVSFFQDADGQYAANVRLYDSSMPALGGKPASSRVRRRGCPCCCAQPTHPCAHLKGSRGKAPLINPR